MKTVKEKYFGKKKIYISNQIVLQTNVTHELTAQTSCKKDTKLNKDKVSVSD